MYILNYRADSIFRCKLCKYYISFNVDGLTYEKSRLEASFPWLQVAFDSVLKELNSEYAISNPEDICYDVCTHEQDEIDKSSALDDYLIAHVNKNNHGWIANRNERFEGMTLGQVKVMMGTIVDEDVVVKLPLKPNDITNSSNSKVDIQQDLPLNFEPKEKWPECTNIYHARDQSNCGSCWAHGTTEALEDRLCIKNGPGQVLSVADTTGCCGFIDCSSMGCDGGQIGTPWDWFINTGVVTGGDYGDESLCYPYTMPQCAHHVESKDLKDCGQIKQVAPQCKSTCSGNSTITYGKDKHHGSSSYSVDTEHELMNELYTNGPITVAFTVYSDFLTYKSGVYKHSGSGSALGGHAVKLIGWGVEDDGTKYWLVVNSWNMTWGDNGKFKIVRGTQGDEYSPGFEYGNAMGLV